MYFHPIIPAIAEEEGGGGIPIACVIRVGFFHAGNVVLLIGWCKISGLLRFYVVESPNVSVRPPVRLPDPNSYRNKHRKYFLQ